MSRINSRKIEYGGFLPLELNPGEEYFAAYDDRLGRFNSVKAALDFLIRRLGLKKMHIPYYYCPSTIAAIKNAGIEVCFYHINEEFLPIDLPDEKNSLVLLADYFGICTKKIIEAADMFQNAEIIIDRAHGFFAKPLIRGHVHNVYSAKKFFGIPDGAYLISPAVTLDVHMQSEAHEYADYLLMSYESGTNAAYCKKKEADQRLSVDYGGMSKLAVGLLKNVDYNRVKKRRKENYKFLLSSFRNINELKLPKTSAAYQFPLLISKEGREIKQRLIEEHIFVSTLWDGKDLAERGNAFEINMMENAVFLPMDQRYDEKDMGYIVSRVKKHMADINSKRDIVSG